MSDPQCVTLPDGTREWRVSGKLHRDDGPAKILADGSQFWYRDGKLHRDDGPAIIRANGNQAWYFNDKFHHWVKNRNNSDCIYLT